MDNRLYNLPWKYNNNPNGWIEPTTFCQLKCPQCYRGCDRTDHIPAHRNLDDLKLEVDKFIKERNIETISISGGEPLLYPYLDDLITYIKDKGVKVMIFTNGILLDENKLTSFSKLGVNQILLHVDKYQNRDEAKSIEEVNKIKEKYCQLFRKIRGVSLGFIEPISNDNYDDLEKILNFYKKNNDIVGLIDFTIATETFNAEVNKNNHGISLQKIGDKIKETYNIEYSTCINKALTDEPAWLCGTAVFSGDKLLGCVDKDVVKFIQENHYKINKRYIFIDNNYPINFKSVLNFFTNKSLRDISIKYLKQKNKGKIYFQVILIVVPPELKVDRFNICSSCPDAMYYKGKLIPSCILGRVERGMCDNYKFYCEDYKK